MSDIYILNDEEIEKLKVSGRILAKAMEKVCDSAKEGISTYELDRIAEEFILSQDGRPSFKNYEIKGVGCYPASLCVSINEEVVHGIPKKDRFLKNGDLVSFDLGVSYKSIFTDMARTIAVGQVKEEDKTLIEVTKNSLDIAIDQVKIGVSVSNIGKNIEVYVKKFGFGIVRDLVGHGIGTKPHMGPQIPNFDDGFEREVIQEGMALAIEPMITAGTHKVTVAPDGWTYVSADHSRAAHFEDTIVIHKGQKLIVTRT